MLDLVPIETEKKLSDLKRKLEILNKNQRKKIEYEKDNYNKQQNFLYKRALFGLSCYTRKEINELNFDKKRRILKVYKRAQSVVNLLKQERVNKLCNSIIRAYFKDSILGKQLLSDEWCNITDFKIKNNLDFKTLGITKSDIIDTFIKEDILPKNFYEIKDL